MVSITENDSEDCSFGYGCAQYLTGELPGFTAAVTMAIG
jgi:hypothetical protein